MDDEIQNLVMRVWEGDPFAFKILFMKFYPKLLIFINGFLKDEEISKDICQNIFFQIWRDREKLKGIRNLDSYLFFVAKGAVFNFFDHSKVDRKYIEHILHSPMNIEDAEERLFADELMRRIKRLVDKMPQKRKIIFRLSREKGLTNEEISKSMNISKRTVENHISAALRDIRKELNLIIFVMFLVCKQWL
jgi:RNA polymerase sigma-70 factor (family 1)